jgi:hypothetical protein
MGSESEIIPTADGTTTKIIVLSPKENVSR